MHEYISEAKNNMCNLFFQLNVIQLTHIPLCHMRAGDIIMLLYCLRSADHFLLLPSVNKLRLKPELKDFPLSSTEAGMYYS